MDLRPQSHEIIRTWAFYSIVKAYLHEGTIPWRNVAISGWILDPDRKKMSKSRGNVVIPLHLLNEYGSDAIRYWAGNAQLGADTAFDASVLKVGKRLVTKIFNASKFVLGRQSPSASISYPMDRVFLLRLRDLVRRATVAFESYDYQVALAETERFFWTSFTDTYIEMSRSRTQGILGSEAQESAITALNLALNVLLRLFAPFLPYITEEVWSWAFAAATGHPNIHKAPWPSDLDFAGISPYEEDAIFDVAVEALSTINKGRAKAGVSTAREIQTAVLAARPAVLNCLTLVKDDIRLAARTHQLILVEDAQLVETGIEVRDLQFSNAPSISPCGD